MITRIPLTIVAPGGETDGVIVAVLASELDELERAARRSAEVRPRVSGTCWGRHHRQCSGRKCGCECHTDHPSGREGDR